MADPALPVPTPLPEGSDSNADLADNRNKANGGADADANADANAATADADPSKKAQSSETEEEMKARHAAELAAIEADVKEKLTHVGKKNRKKKQALWAVANAATDEAKARHAQELADAGFELGEWFHFDFPPTTIATTVATVSTAVHYESHQSMCHAQNMHLRRAYPTMPLVLCT